jgi:hypothetical protein
LHEVVHGPKLSLILSTAASLGSQQGVGVKHIQGQIHTVKADLSRINVILFQVRERLFKELITKRALKIRELHNRKRRTL